MVLVIVTASWLAAVVATLRFHEVVVPVMDKLEAKLILSSLRKNASAAGRLVYANSTATTDHDDDASGGGGCLESCSSSSSSRIGRDKLLGLLPPWQQMLVHSPTSRQKKQDDVVAASSSHEEVDTENASDDHVDSLAESRYMENNEEDEDVGVEVVATSLSEGTTVSEQQQIINDYEETALDAQQHELHESSSSLAGGIGSTIRESILPLDASEPPTSEEKMDTEKNAEEDVESASTASEEVYVEPTTSPLSSDKKLCSDQFIHKLGEIATIITSLSIMLSIIYSLAVHSFLSSFRERSFFKGMHWHPVGVRVIVAFVIWGLRWVLLMRLIPSNVDRAVQSAAEIVFAIAASITSIKFILRTRRKEVDGPIPPYVCMKGKVVFITGANAGIGLETARQLYQRGATVLLGCRSKKRALDAMQDIEPSFQQQHQEEPHGMHFIQLDLTSNASIQGSVQTFHNMNMPLHILINNAGVMRNKREETVDGLETTMAANHLGHFLLTNLLLPKLRETVIKEGCPSRVITVSSSLYCNARRITGGIGTLEPGVDLQDLQCKHKAFSLFEQYAQSKLANIMFSQELGRRERMTIEQQQLQSAPEQSNNLSTPPMKKKKKLRPKLTPVDKVPSLDEVDEVGLGFSDIMPSEISQTPPPMEKEKRKKLRPKLTPIENVPPSDDVDEVGLGFSDIMPAENHSTPPRKKEKKKKLRPKLTPVEKFPSSEDIDEVGLGFNEETRKKLRPKLTPVEILPSSDEVDEVGLGFNDIVPSDNQSTPPMKEKKKLRPKLTPVEKLPSSDDIDEVGLGFSDIMPSPTLAPTLGKKEKKKIRPKLTPLSDTNNVGEVVAVPSNADEKARCKLKPTSPSIVAREGDTDEVGLGFNDIVSIATQQRKTRPNLMPITPSIVVEEKKDYYDSWTKTKTMCPSKVAEEEYNETGLGFNDIVSAPTPKRRVSPTPPLKAERDCDNGGIAMTCDGNESNDTDVQHKSFCPVRSFCLHPGLVRTNVVRDMPWYLYYPNKVFAIFMAMLQKTPEAGAYTTVFCAVMDVVEMDYDESSYFVNSELQPLNKLALCKKDAKQLWELSSKVLSIS